MQFYRFNITKILKSFHLKRELLAGSAIHFNSLRTGEAEEGVQWKLGNIVNSGLFGVQ